MHFELKDVLNTAGPTATLVFASWIFLQYLNQRYMAAYDRYMSLIDAFRNHKDHDQRHQSLCDQIRLYKRRCQQMRLATIVGLVAAILLMLTLTTAGIEMAFGPFNFLKLCSFGCMTLALLLLIAATGIVIVENILIQHAIDSELSDIPEFTDHRAQHPGTRQSKQQAQARS